MQAADRGIQVHRFPLDFLKSVLRSCSMCHYVDPTDQQRGRTYHCQCVHYGPDLPGSCENTSPLVLNTLTGWGERKGEGGRQEREILPVPLVFL